MYLELCITMMICLVLLFFKYLSLPKVIYNNNVSFCERNEIIFNSFESPEIQLQILVGKSAITNIMKYSEVIEKLEIIKTIKFTSYTDTNKSKICAYYFYFLLIFRQILEYENNASTFIMNLISTKSEENFLSDTKYYEQCQKLFNNKNPTSKKTRKYRNNSIVDITDFLVFLPSCSILFYNCVKNGYIIKENGCLITKTGDFILKNGLISIGKDMLGKSLLRLLGSDYLKNCKSFLSKTTTLYKLQDIRLFLQYSIEQNVHANHTNFLLTIIYDYSILIVEAIKFLKERSKDEGDNVSELIRNRIFTGIIKREDLTAKYIEKENILQINQKAILKITIIEEFDFVQLNHALQILYFEEDKKINIKDSDKKNFLGIISDVSSIIQELYETAKKYFEDANPLVKIKIFIFKKNLEFTSSTVSPTLVGEKKDQVSMSTEKQNPGF